MTRAGEYGGDHLRRGDADVREQRRSYGRARRPPVPFPACHGIPVILPRVPCATIPPRHSHTLSRPLRGRTGFSRPRGGRAPYTGGPSGQIASRTVTAGARRRIPRAGAASGRRRVSCVPARPPVGTGGAQAGASGGEPFYLILQAAQLPQLPVDLQCQDALVGVAPP